MSTRESPSDWGFEWGFQHWCCKPVVKQDASQSLAEQLSIEAIVIEVVPCLPYDLCELIFEYTRPSVTERSNGELSTSGNNNHFHCGPFWMQNAEGKYEGLTQTSFLATVKPRWRHALHIQTSTIDAAWNTLGIPPRVSFLWHAYMGAMLESNTGPVTSRSSAGSMWLGNVPLVVGLDMTTIGKLLNACLRTRVNGDKPSACITTITDDASLESLLHSSGWLSAGQLRTFELQCLCDGEQMLILAGAEDGGPLGDGYYRSEAFAQNGLMGFAEWPRFLSGALQRRAVVFDFSDVSVQARREFEATILARAEDGCELDDWVRKCILCKRHTELVARQHGLSFIASGRVGNGALVHRHLASHIPELVQATASMFNRYAAFTYD